MSENERIAERADRGTRESDCSTRGMKEVVTGTNRLVNAEVTKAKELLNLVDARKYVRNEAADGV